MKKLVNSLLLCLLFLILSHISVNASAKYAKIDDSFQLFYQDSGRGEQVILFIPGWTMSSQVFEYQLAHFEDSKKYRAIAIDPRGQGRSSKTSSGYTYKQRGKDLANFINKLNLEQVILVGWSFGALDMLSYISQYGVSNVKGVMLLDGSPKTMSTNLKGAWAWIDQNDTDLIRQSTTLAVLSEPEQFYQQFAQWMLDQPTAARVKKITEIAYQTPPFVAALTNETASYANYEDTLIGLDKKLPVYLFVRNEWASIVESWMKKHTPNAKFSHMGKHLMFWEHHQKFNQKLDEFLKMCN
ncbi:MAG: alpha/beta hydrolase [Thalassotalea sp.]|nr:alpha/beta hydrolase [Thalassotalea sp.]